jgi:hypothetical protein
LIERYASSIDLRNIDGIMAKDMGEWHIETHNAFHDYYRQVDQMILSSQAEDQQFNLEIIKSRF